MNRLRTLTLVCVAVLGVACTSQHDSGNGKRAGRLGRSGRAGRHHLHPCEHRLTGVSALPHQNPGRPSTGCLGVPDHGWAVQLWTPGALCQEGDWVHHSPMTTTADRLSHPGPPSIAPGRRCSFNARSTPIKQGPFAAKTKARLPVSSSTLVPDVLNRGSSQGRNPASFVFVFVFCSRSRAILWRSLSPQPALPRNHPVG